MMLARGMTVAARTDLWIGPGDGVLAGTKGTIEHADERSVCVAFSDGTEICWTGDAFFPRDTVHEDLMLAAVAVCPECGSRKLISNGALRAEDRSYECCRCGHGWDVANVPESEVPRG